MPIFGIAIDAQKHTANVVQITQIVVTLRAANHREAYGIGYEIAQERCPQSDGYYGHMIAVADVPTNWIIEEAKALVRQAREG